MKKFKYEDAKMHIPDYDNIFNKGEKSKFFSNMYKANSKNFFFSLIIYLIKASPVYIIPICTSNIINIATKALQDNSDVSWNKILINAIVIIVFLIQNIPMHTWYSRITDNMLRNSSAGLREAVIRRLQHLSITYHKEIESGRLQSKFIRDIENTDNYLSSLIKSFIPAIISAIIAIGISIYSNGLITLFFVVVVPINVLITQLFRKKIKHNNRQYRIANEEMSNRFTSMLEMIPVTKAHGLEEAQIKDMDREVKNMKSTGLKVDYVNAFFGSTIWVIGNLLSFSCVLFSTYLAINKKIEIGDILLYQSLFANINGNIQVIINLIPQLSSGAESVKSLSEIMTNDEIETDVNKESIDDVKGDVSFNNVSFTYPHSDKGVIKDFSLNVKSGECIALVGPSGSGKSTIMNLIIGLLKPNDGKICIDDKDLSTLSMKEYRRFLSVVPQSAILFKGSVKENITYGLSSYSEQDLNKVLQMANINEFLKDMPNGIDSEIAEHGANLSGGQKQRITIARALIRNPKILIFDEATSALDNISEYHVQKAISQAVVNRTTFIVAHRLSTIRNADRILVMDDGRCVEMGTYDELMAKKGKFYEMKSLNDATYKTAENLLQE